MSSSDNAHDAGREATEASSRNGDATQAQRSFQRLALLYRASAIANGTYTPNLQPAASNARSDGDEV